MKRLVALFVPLALAVGLVGCAHSTYSTETDRQLVAGHDRTAAQGYTRRQVKDANDRYDRDRNVNGQQTAESPAGSGTSMY